MATSSDQLLKLMAGAKSGTAAKPPSAEMSPQNAMSDQETPPMGAPMSTPEPKMGSREGALITLGMAVDLIEQSLPALGPESEDTNKAMQAVRALNGVLGPRKSKTNELQSSEILQMLQSLPQAAGMSPETRAMSGAPISGLPPQLAQAANQ